MKLLPIRINDKQIEHMVDFENRNESDNAFIIATEVGDAKQNRCLFGLCRGIDRGGSVLYQKEEQSSLYIQEISMNADETEIKIVLGTDSPNQRIFGVNRKLYSWIIDYTVSENVIPFQFVLNQDGDVNDIKTIKVTFILDGISKVIYFHLAPKGQIRDAVIDAGSEACQIAIFKRDENEIGNRNIYPIMNGVYRFFKNNPTVDKKDIKCTYQAEVKGRRYDERLLKSVFFAKNVIDNIEENDVIVGDNDKSDEALLRMYVSQNDQNLGEGYIPLCNMKIAAFGGLNLPKIVVGGEDISVMDINPKFFFYRKYISLFVERILTNICSTNEGRNSKLLSLYILMPNVYSSKMVQEFLNYIREDVRKLIKSGNDRFGKVKGFSVNAISESDASFIGAVKNNILCLAEDQNTQEIADGKYLIMDAGKGTLDFSIIEKKKENGKDIFYGVMQDGIIGASATISYGFMLDLIEEYKRVHNLDIELREFISDIILEGDTYFINEILSYVDKYKIKYSSLRQNNDFDINNVSIDPERVSTVEGFNEWVQILVRNGYRIPAIRYVNAIVDVIVENVIDKIVGLGSVDKVVFAGRGFLYEDLKNKMLEKLQEINSGLQECIVQEDLFLNPKNICLFIPNAVSNGEYKKSYVSKPNIVPPPPENSIEKLAWRRRKSERTIEITEDFSLGVTIDILQQKGSSINIGGTYYKYDKRITDDSLVFCDSKGQIIVRNNNGTIILNEIRNLEIGLARPSLFPNYIIEEENEIYIPTVVVDNTSNIEMDNAPEEPVEKIEEKELQEQQREEKIEEKQEEKVEEKPVSPEVKVRFDSAEFE